MSERMAPEQRVEWLHDFDKAHRIAHAAVYQLRGMSEDLHVVCMDGLADRVSEYAEVLSVAIETMNKAVSRMIHEDLTEGQKQIDETFKALLTTVLNSTEQPTTS